MPVSSIGTLVAALAVATSVPDTGALRLLLRVVDPVLVLAAALTIAIGLVHSVLGEKYILQRLFRNPLPKLFGTDQFTKQTLRFAWHITTLAWFGFAVQMILLATGDNTRSTTLLVTAGTFALTGLVALVASRGKHLSWLVFGSIAVLCYVSASGN